jgi:hypothetical protein
MPSLYAMAIPRRRSDRPKRWSIAANRSSVVIASPGSAAPVPSTRRGVRSDQTAGDDKPLTERGHPEAGLGP